jgi:transglutaminase-like putative cysteine protease
MQRYFQISCHALIVSAFIALALTGRLDGPSIGLFTIGLCISVYRTARRMPPLLTPRGAFYFSCGYILFFLFDTFVLSRSFIPASIHLVLFLELAKLFQEKKDKDYFYLIVLSFLQVLAASSLTIDMSFVATLFLFLVALVSTLMSFDMYRSERKTAARIEQVGVPLGGMSLWATIWIILIGVALFFTIPRVGTGYFSRADTPALLLTGFTDSVQLGDIGQVKLSQAVVMHARPISGTPFAVLKWRGISLDTFDGHNWYKTDRKRFAVPRSPEGEYSIRPLSPSGDSARFDVLLEPLATTALFGPHEIRSLSGRLPGMEIDNEDSAYLRFQTLRRVQYEVTSEIPNRNRWLAGSKKEDPIPPEIRTKYLKLPAETDPRIAELAQQITARGSSTIEKATLVEGYLKRTYRYTLNLTWKPGPQPVSTFLFEAKAGHCEYFASSMAILLRSVGVPTRIVNGFLMGEYNPVGGDYIVRQSDAHSWVEVYIPGRGWLEFDPTPPDPNHREMDLAMQISHYVDAMQLFWNSYILIYDSGAQLQLFRSAQDRVQSIQYSMRQKSDQWMVRSMTFSDRFARVVRRWVENGWFWIAVAGVLLLGTAYKHRRQLKTHLEIWRLRHGRGRVNQDVVEQLFYRAARLAEGRSEKRRPAETWREWIFGLPDPDRRSILTRALEIFEKSKYGRIPVSPAEFASLEETIRDLKSGNMGSDPSLRDFSG